jgi:hypothetical protein
LPASQNLTRLTRKSLPIAFGALLGVAYVYAMLIHPWIEGGLKWNHVQEVWDRWQALNVGILAFASSVIAFSIAKYNANEQRAREFTAAKAFLPATLSSLISYYKASKKFLEAAGTALAPKIAPTPPEEYRSVFSECIRHARPEVGAALTRILVRMQVHDARLRDAAAHGSVDMHTLIAYLYRLGELQARVNKLFDFSRDEAEFDGTPVNWDELKNAFQNLNIYVSDYHIDEKMNLEAFSKRALLRESE